MSKAKLDWTLFEKAAAAVKQAAPPKKEVAPSDEFTAAELARPLRGAFDSAGVDSIAAPTLGQFIGGPRGRHPFNDPWSNSYRPSGPRTALGPKPIPPASAEQQYRSQTGMAPSEGAMAAVLQKLTGINATPQGGLAQGGGLADRLGSRFGIPGEIAPGSRMPSDAIDHGIQSLFGQHMRKGLREREYGPGFPEDAEGGMPQGKDYLSELHSDLRGPTSQPGDPPWEPSRDPWARPHLRNAEISPADNMPPMAPDPAAWQGPRQGAGRAMKEYEKAQRGKGNLSMGRQELNPTTGKSRKQDPKVPKLPGKPRAGAI